MIRLRPQSLAGSYWGSRRPYSLSASSSLGQAVRPASSCSYIPLPAHRNKMASPLQITLHHSSVSIGSQNPPTAESLINYFKGIQDWQMRYRTQWEVMHFLLVKQTQVENYLGLVYERIRNDLTIVQQQRQDPLWGQIESVATRARERRNKAQEERRKIAALWSRELIDRVVEGEIAHYILMKIRKLAEKKSFVNRKRSEAQRNWRDVRRMLEVAIVERLSKSRKNLSTNSEYQAQNFKAARSGQFDDSSKFSQEDLRRVNISESSNDIEYVAGYQFSDRAEIMTSELLMLREVLFTSTPAFPSLAPPYPRDSSRTFRQSADEASSTSSPLFIEGRRSISRAQEMTSPAQDMISLAQETPLLSSAWTPMNQPRRSDCLAILSEPSSTAGMATPRAQGRAAARVRSLVPPSEEDTLSCMPPSLPDKKKMTENIIQ